MAVAVKTSQGARSAGPRTSAAILSLVGVVYLLGCLGIVFWLIPGLWWQAWSSIGLGSYTFVGGSVLAVVGLLLAVALLIVGARLLGPNPPAGVRAGVFVGFLGLLLVVLLTRWASLWAEHWAYNGSITRGTGLIGTAIAGGSLLVAWLVIFFSAGTQKNIIALEQAGWFHATRYKSNQGQKVRRGTIAGLLLLVGAGIYTLISHNTLGRGSPDWKINIPFTGTVAIESFGDTRELLAASGADLNQVEIRWPGASDFKKGETVDYDKYRIEVEKLVKSNAELTAALADAKDAPAFLMAVNEKILGKRMATMLREHYFSEGETRRLEVRFESTPWEDLGDLVGDFSRAAKAEEKKAAEKDGSKKPGLEFAVPSAVLLVDRYALRAVNAQTAEGENVKVVFKGDSDLKEGEVVSTAKFDEEVSRLEELRKQGRDRTLPKSVNLASASGKTQYAGLTLLPSVQFTVPLLLLAASLWLAWRVVNMPAFADFLIATEAELNKVSWTTQKKLVQDTTVVLVTVVLMAVFLFGMDWTWKVVLSWKPIGVLHIPPPEESQSKSVKNQRY